MQFARNRPPFVLLSAYQLRRQLLQLAPALNDLGMLLPDPGFQTTCVPGRESRNPESEEDGDAADTPYTAPRACIHQIQPLLILVESLFVKRSDAVRNADDHVALGNH